MSDPNQQQEAVERLRLACAEMFAGLRPRSKFVTEDVQLLLASRDKLETENAGALRKVQEAYKQAGYYRTRAESAEAERNQLSAEVEGWIKAFGMARDEINEVRAENLQLSARLTAMEGALIVTYSDDGAVVNVEHRLGPDAWNKAYLGIKAAYVELGRQLKDHAKCPAAPKATRIRCSLGHDCTCKPKKWDCFNAIRQALQAPSTPRRGKGET